MKLEEIKAWVREILGSSVVDELGKEDADGDIELKQDVKTPTDSGRCNLREEQRDCLQSMEWKNRVKKSRKKNAQP